MQLYSSSSSRSIRAVYRGLFGEGHRQACWGAKGYTQSSAFDETDYPVTITFEVSRVWKGPLRQRQSISVPNTDPGGCNFSFPEGREFLVFAEGNEAELHAEYTLCNGTQIATWAVKIGAFKALGVGKSPAP